VTNVSLSIANSGDLLLGKAVLSVEETIILLEDDQSRLRKFDDARASHGYVAMYVSSWISPC
jgi:hypothetical protein